MWLLASFAFLGSTLAHASTHWTPVLADIAVPEPSSTMLGAGLLLVGMGIARKRLKN
jgi:hypothetical protein